ncbi:sensor domain-containing diguanylate cyclase [Castellaniella sp.]|uniref:GGDEF domain-containing protein n=1 Tax=Castellaniella sp. TaxID=1955812 RepID=UPI002AFED3A9|nr:sensor domain-containing diguanylate cyclase [Castellaniella sp.]
MQIRKPSRITLRQLVLILSIGSVLTMLVAGIAGAYRIQRDQLMEDTLAANQAFAEKLAASTSDLLSQAQQDLAYSAERIVQSGMNPAMLQSEVERLRAQGTGFNAVSITGSQGVILAIAPAALNVRGRRVDRSDPRSALRHQTPMISSPFTSILGNLSILISHPLYTAKDQYLGYLAGTVYLKSDGGLSRLIGRHYFRNDTYVYVVDATHRLLYHPQANRIGTEVNYDNPAINAVLQGRSGALRITNSQGIDMLAGFAYVPSTQWGIVVQRPTQVTLARLDALMHRALWLSLIPVGLLLALLWFLASWVSRPLGELALVVQDGYEDNMARRIQSIRCWYFEAQRLQRALLESLGAVGAQLDQLHDEAYQDPLTGLGNRRGLNLALQTFQTLEQPFAVITLDIDFFKHINDTYGHDTGDQVIRQIGQWMRNQAREGDTLFRMGGEEFLTILPGARQDIAANMAERLRAGIEQATILPGETVTVSIGVASWTPEDAADTTQVLKAADQALYRAKQTGRNRVVQSDDLIGMPET